MPKTFEEWTQSGVEISLYNAFAAHDSEIADLQAQFEQSKRAFVELTKIQGEQARQLAASREIMKCGHPKSCRDFQVLLVPDEPTGEIRVPFCTLCAELAEVRQSAEEAGSQQTYILLRNHVLLAEQIKAVEATRSQWLVNHGALSRIVAKAVREALGKAWWNARTPVPPGSGDYQLGFLEGQEKSQAAIAALDADGPNHKLDLVGGKHDEGVYLDADAGGSTPGEGK